MAYAGVVSQQQYGQYAAPSAMPAYAAGPAAAYSTTAAQATYPAAAGGGSYTAAPAAAYPLSGGSYTAAPASAYSTQQAPGQSFAAAPAYAQAAYAGAYGTSPYAAPSAAPAGLAAHTTAPSPYAAHTTATAYSAPQQPPAYAVPQGMTQPATYAIPQDPSQLPSAASMIAYPGAPTAGAQGPFPFYAQQQQQAASVGAMQPPTLVVPVGPGAAYSGQGPLSPSQQADGPPASLAPATVVPPAEDGYHGPKRTNSKKGKQGKSGRKSPKKTCC